MRVLRKKTKKNSSSEHGNEEDQETHESSVDESDSGTADQSTEPADTEDQAPNETDTYGTEFIAEHVEPPSLDEREQAEEDQETTEDDRETPKTAAILFSDTDLAKIISDHLQANEFKVTLELTAKDLAGKKPSKPLLEAYSDIANSPPGLVISALEPPQMSESEDEAEQDGRKAEEYLDSQVGQMVDVMRFLPQESVAVIGYTGIKTTPATSQFFTEGFIHMRDTSGSEASAAAIDATDPDKFAAALSLLLSGESHYEETDATATAWMHPPKKSNAFDAGPSYMDNINIVEEDTMDSDPEELNLQDMDSEAYADENEDTDGNGPDFGALSEMIAENEGAPPQEPQEDPSMHLDASSLSAIISAKPTDDPDVVSAGSGMADDSSMGLRALGEDEEDPETSTPGYGATPAAVLKVDQIAADDEDLKRIAEMVSERVAQETEDKDTEQLAQRAAELIAQEGLSALSETGLEQLAEAAAEKVVESVPEDFVSQVAAKIEGDVLDQMTESLSDDPQDASTFAIEPQGTDSEEEPDGHTPEDGTTEDRPAEHEPDPESDIEPAAHHDDVSDEEIITEEDLADLADLVITTDSDSQDPYRKEPQDDPSQTDLTEDYDKDKVADLEDTIKSLTAMMAAQQESAHAASVEQTRILESIAASVEDLKTEITSSTDVLKAALGELQSRPDRPTDKQTQDAIAKAASEHTAMLDMSHESLTEQLHHISAKISENSGKTAEMNLALKDRGLTKEDLTDAISVLALETEDRAEKAEELRLERMLAALDGLHKVLTDSAARDHEELMASVARFQESQTDYDETEPTPSDFMEILGTIRDSVTEEGSPKSTLKKILSRLDAIQTDVTEVKTHKEVQEFLDSFQKVMKIVGAPQTAQDPDLTDGS